MAPRTLTKAEFLKLRPKGNYANYRAYINRARAARRLPNDPLAPLSPTQLQSLVNEQVRNAIAPERTEIQRQREDATRNARERADVIRGFTEAQAALAKQVSPQIQAVSEGAAKTVGGLAEGMEGAIGEALRNVQGAPTTAIGNAVSYSGGFVPGEAMTREGAGWASRAAFLPDEAMSTGRIRLSAAQREALETDAEYAQALVDLAGKTPALRDQILQRLQQHEVSKDAQRTQRGYLRLSGAKTLQEEANAKTDYFGTVHEVRNGKVVDTGRIAYGSDAYSNVAAKETAANKDKPTPAERKKARNEAVEARKDAFQQARTSINGELDDLVDEVPDPASFGGTKRVPKMTYSEAFSYLYNLYGQDLLRYSSRSGRAKTRREVGRMIDQALATIGLRKPARSGFARKTGPAPTKELDAPQGTNRPPRGG